MEIGFYHPERGYWQAIDVSKEPYEIVIEPERVEDDLDEKGEIIGTKIVPAVYGSTSQYDELVASYPEGTKEVPLKPGENFAWINDVWEATPPAPPPVREDISRRQFFEGLAEIKLITKDEAFDAVASGVIPPALMAIVNGMTDEDAKFKAKMLLAGATEYFRSHPLVMVFAVVQGMSEAEVDNFWRLCASL